MAENRDADASRLAAESPDDPTGWFDRLYLEASTGDAVVPWDVGEPIPFLTEWTDRQGTEGTGKRALVVGSGYGRDAEHIAGLGFQTTAFDISETAIRDTRGRFPESAVDYLAADLLDPPAEWTGGFDFVLESITVQSLPVSLRAKAIERIRRFVAPDGELLVISAIRDEGAQVDGPPWPLTRTELESFEADGLRAARIEQVPMASNPEVFWWRALFRRD